MTIKLAGVNEVRLVNDRDKPMNNATQLTPRDLHGKAYTGNP